MSASSPRTASPSRSTPTRTTCSRKTQPSTPDDTTPPLDDTTRGRRTALHDERVTHDTGAPTLTGAPVGRGFGRHERPHQGETNEWYTPPEIFTALDVTFDLDPCSPGADRTHVPAREHYTHDGLERPWHGLVWLNPPYGRHTGLWLDKLAEHGQGIALVYARTDTTWFHRAACQANAVCFIAGRIRFIRGATGQRAPSNAGAGSCLLAYGRKAALVVADAQLGLVGRVV